MGFTLYEIKLCTTDEHWDECFVKRGATDSIHKLLNMSCLAVYHDVQADQLKALADSDWEQRMLDMISTHPVNDSSLKVPPPTVPLCAYLFPTSLPTYVPTTVPTTAYISVLGHTRAHFTSATIIPTEIYYSAASLQPLSCTTLTLNTTPRTMHPSIPLPPPQPAGVVDRFIVAPTDTVNIRLTHKETALKSEPKIDVQVATSDRIQIQLDNKQYLQLTFASTALSLQERKQSMLLQRPVERPNKDPRAWWKYAYRLVTGRSSTAVDVFAQAIKCRRSKVIPKYKSTHVCHGALLCSSAL